MKTETERFRLFSRCSTACLIVLLALFYAPALLAQVLYGSIVGTVRDATGAVLPGATVTITHNETKATRETATDATGSYRFSTVQTGTYTVVVDAHRHADVHAQRRAGDAEHGRARRCLARRRLSCRKPSLSRPSRRCSRPIARRCGRSSARASCRTCPSRSGAIIRSCSSRCPASRRRPTHTRFPRTRRAR